MIGPCTQMTSCLLPSCAALLRLCNIHVLHGAPLGQVWHETFFPLSLCHTLHCGALKSTLFGLSGNVVFRHLLRATLCSIMLPRNHLRLENTCCRCAGCLAVGREDGIVEVWDLLDRCHEPVMACTVSVAAVTSLCFSPAEEKSDSNAKIASHRQYLAAGACCNLHMHEGPEQSASSVFFFISQQMCRLLWQELCLYSNQPTLAARTGRLCSV